MIKKITPLIFLLSTSYAWAVNSPITGTVQASCSIVTTTPGQYGLPNVWKLSSLPADGGIDAIIKTTIAAADTYKVKFTHPNSFSSSPGLSDTLTWGGSTSYSSGSVAAMSNYEAAKTVVGNETTFDMTLAGTTFFKVNSSVTYGYNKAFPSGDYVGMIVVLCQAK
jgi:hypothetical protein